METISAYLSTWHIYLCVIHWIIQSLYIILRKNCPQYFTAVIFGLKYRNHFFLTCKVDWWKMSKFFGRCIKTYKTYMLCISFIKTMLQSNKKIIIHDFWPDFFIYFSSWSQSLNIFSTSWNAKIKVLKITQTNSGSQQTGHFKFLWSP